VLSGSAIISSSTITGNILDDPDPAYGGGGVYGGPAVFQNSILANNSGGNCGGTANSHGYNLSSDDTCSFNGPGDRNNTDPELGTLGYHGGPTETVSLLPGSPAIDAGNPYGCYDGLGEVLKVDQRGEPRLEQRGHLPLRYWRV
jgi:hypothetical protein